MPGENAFRHLKLVRIASRTARIHGGGKEAELTKRHKANPAEHSRALLEQANLALTHWRRVDTERAAAGLPTLPAGRPFLLRVDPGLELDDLRKRLGLEIVSEEEDGFVLVASHELDLGQVVSLTNDFATRVHGSAVVAQVHQLTGGGQPEERLRRVLSTTLLARWPGLGGEAALTVDVTIACTGTEQVPEPPKERRKDSKAKRAARLRDHQQASAQVCQRWDELRDTREEELRTFLATYDAGILRSFDGAGMLTILPDCFTVRIQLSGQALLDLALNYPFVHEIVEPDDASLPIAREVPSHDQPAAIPVGPVAEAPAVCVIDSGIQEQHRLLAPAIEQSTSRCFLPGGSLSDVADQVPSGGHGTRVAGAVLYGEAVPTAGRPQLPFWIHNARVLDDKNKLPLTALPGALMAQVVKHFSQGDPRPRIFNQSINATVAARSVHMSTWAAVIDNLCAADDVLFVQSAGNIDNYGPGLTPERPGVADHLAKGRTYPDYLDEPSSRIANPAQSLHALTVGSVAYQAATAPGWRSIADADQPSAFTRSGPGIWGAIKPEVVDYGGDYIVDSTATPQVSFAAPLPNTAPELVRSTMFEPPAAARDTVGTSFAAPKVARIAAYVQAELPDEPVLIYRALVVQSARWPAWAEQMLAEYRSIQGNGKAAKARRAALRAEFAKVIHRIGYGIPDQLRATTNTDHRTTLITSDAIALQAGYCHAYQVPIPEALRRPGNDFDVRIEVTLAYVASPRRTRRTPRHYLSTWLTWRSSNLNETPERFCKRVLKEAAQDEEQSQANAPKIVARGIPWTIQDNADHGLVRGVRRGAGTAQKDWAVVPAGDLPASFCIGVIGHRGWNRDPGAIAKYSLAVTIEVQGQEIAIYDLLRAEVEELRSEVEAEAVEQEVDVHS